MKIHYSTIQLYSVYTFVTTISRDSYDFQQDFANMPFFSLILHPSPISPLPSPVFSELWSGDQAARDSLFLSEPNQNRGGALQSSASAADTESLSGEGMPQLEGQQVEGGMFALLSFPTGSQNSPGLSGTSSWDTSTNTANGFPEVADVGHIHTEHLSNHHSIYSCSRVMCKFLKCELNTMGWIRKTVYVVPLTF